MKLIVAGLLAALSVGEAAAAELLFKVDFDGSAVATVAKGRAEPLKARNLAYARGKRGEAVRLKRGLGQLLEYASADNLVQERGTVAMWVKREWPDEGRAPDGGEVSRMLFSQQPPDVRRGSGMLAFWHWGARLRADVSDFGDSYVCRSHPADGRWAHLVFTWDGASARLAVNGRMPPQINGNGSPLARAAAAGRRDGPFDRKTFDTFFVGNRAGDRFADALIDDLRIYSAPLTAEETKALYDELATDEDRAAAAPPDYAKLFANRPNPYEGGEELELEPVETVTLDAAGVRRLAAADRFKAYRTTEFGALGGTPYLAAEPREGARFAVRFRLDPSVPLYCFDIDYPDDRVRTMDLLIQKSDQTAWDGDVGADYTMQVGVMTGGQYANTGRILTHRCLYWTRGADVSLLAMTARDGGPAAISSVRVSRVKGAKLPPLQVREPKPNADGWRRQLALYFEDPAIGYDFSVKEDGYTPEGLSDLIDRTAATMKYAGENLFAYPGAWYDGLIGETYNPRRHAPGFLSAWYAKFDREGLSIMPTLNILDLSVDPALVTASSTGDGSLHPTEIAILDTGRPNPGQWHGTPVNFNIAHTNVQRQLEATVDALVAEGRRHPSFKGLCLNLSRHALMTFGGIEAGYNDYCIEAFVEGLGSLEGLEGLGGSGGLGGLEELKRVDRTDPLRGRRYARIIRENPALLARWLDWRCDVVAGFWGRMAAKLKAARPDLKLWINVFSTSYVRDPRFLQRDYFACQNREYGLDTAKLERAADNLIVAQSIVPADCRWRRPSEFPETVREASMAKLADYWTKGETWSLLDGASFPWAGQHDRYWECIFGATGGKTGGNWRTATGANATNSLNSAWLRECKWRVTTINPSGRHALAPFVVPLRYHDLLGLSKGGFLIGTYGMEGPLREFAAAYRSLPAVKMDEFFRAGFVVARKAAFDGRVYGYVVNTGATPAEVTVPDFGDFKLEPYELKAFKPVSDN